MLIKHILLLFSAFFFLGSNGAKFKKFYPKSQLHLDFSGESRLSTTLAVLPLISPSPNFALDEVIVGGNSDFGVSSKEISIIFEFSFRDDYLNDGWQFQFEGWNNLKDTHHHLQFLRDLGLIFVD